MIRTTDFAKWVDVGVGDKVVITFCNQLLADRAKGAVVDLQPSVGEFPTCLEVCVEMTVKIVESLTSFVTTRERTINRTFFGWTGGDGARLRSGWC